jgi:hypothetical protein
MPAGMRASAALALILSLAIARPAFAQANYRSSPIGGRSTLMGSTGLAFGRDGAAPFINPATILAVEDEQVAFSVNFYTFTAFSGRNWYQPGPIDNARFGNIAKSNTTLTDLEFNALPSSLCIFLPSSGKSRLAVCLANTQASSFSFNAEHYEAATSDGRKTQQAQTMLLSYSRFLFGPTYAFAVNENLTLGASVHGSLVAHRSVMDASGSTIGGTAAPITSVFYNASRGDSAQLSAVIGAAYKVRRATFAVSVETPSLHVYGVGAANRHTHFEGAGSSTQSIALDGSFVNPTPGRIGAGLGLSGPRGGVELDLFLHLPMSSAYHANLAGTAVTVEGGVAREERLSANISQRASAVLNAAIGGQYFLYPSLSVLGGVSTDFSAVPAGELRGDLFNYYPTRSHRLAASIGLGSHGEGGELMVGTELSWAWGQRIAINSYQLPPTYGVSDHDTFVVLLVVAGSTSLKAIKRAVLDAADAIKSPSALPPR